MVGRNTIESKNLKRKQIVEESLETISKKLKEDGAESNSSPMRMRFRSAASKNNCLPNVIKNNTMIASKRVSFTSKISKKNNHCETFDFPNLPYVCQRRFAEICDPQSLLTFASINSETRKLSRHFHIVDTAAIFFSVAKRFVLFYVKCFCNEKEFCNKDSEEFLPPFEAKVEVMTQLDIFSDMKFPLSFEMMENLPINFDGVKTLSISRVNMHINDLKKLIKPEMKKLIFKMGILSPCSNKNFINFINDLATKLDKLIINLNNSSLPFNFNYLKAHLAEKVRVIHHNDQTMIYI